MIREKTVRIKLEEKDIIVLNEIGNIDCHGVTCDNCDMFMPVGAPIHSCYKHLTKMFLSHRGIKENQTNE